MLGLKLPTDTRWATLAETNLPELLTDHAWCEQKAASNAISLIIGFPAYSELVTQLSAIAQEEMAHFGQVHALILARGWVLGPERKDAYVNELYQLMGKGTNRQAYLTDRLLFGAMIEARSCERFRLLTETVTDPELKAFYHGLMASEAGHYTTFIRLAKLYNDPQAVDSRWRWWLDREKEIVSRYGQAPTMHG